MEIEETATLLGFIIGGPVGVGTLITVFSIGYFIQIAFKLGN